MSFRNAIYDYRFLKNSRYPHKASLKLVGDRYRLTRLQRNCLYRGIVADADSAARKAKIVDSTSLQGKNLAVDWYNVLITVESYLKGSPVFLADDGVLRDASGIHGSYRPGLVTDQATESILKSIAALNLRAVDLFLDSPIPFSGLMAGKLRQSLFEPQATVCTMASA